VHRKVDDLMSGNASRKYKRYILMQERKKLFGNISSKDECGITDYVAFSAANGEITIKKMIYEKK
jgi:hypothetical protein